MLAKGGPIRRRWLLGLMLLLVPANAWSAPADKPTAAPEPASAPKESAGQPADAKASPAAKDAAKPDAAGADAEDLKNRLKQRSEKAKKSQPARKVTRDEHIAKPGAARPMIPYFREGEPLHAEPLTPQENERFERMRQGRIAIDSDLIDRAAKYFVYRVSERGDGDLPARRVSEIQTRINTARQNGEANNNFVKAFKTSCAKYAKDLLKGSLVVRANAVLLLASLCDGAEVHAPVPILLEILSDPSQEDAIAYLALRGLDEAEKNKLVQVDEERTAVNKIFERIEKGSVQSVLFEQMIWSLGRMGRAFRGNEPQRAGVGTFLATLALDGSRPLRLRFAAGLALANLRTHEAAIGWNFELQGLVLARLTRDILRERADGKISDDRFRYWLAELSTSAAFGAGTTKNLGELASIMADLRAQADRGQGPIDGSRLEVWITQHEPPRDRRLAPAAEPLTFPETAARPAAKAD